MKYERIAVAQLNTMHSDIMFIDRYTNELVFASTVAYSPLIQASAKIIGKPGATFFVPGHGSYKATRQGYEVETKKESNSDYSHLITYAKDKISYKEDNTEDITIYIYCNSGEELIDKIYDKVYKYSSVPLLEEWKHALYEGLVNKNKIKTLTCYSIYETTPFAAYRIDFDKATIRDIITDRLKNKTININGCNEASGILPEIHGLNDYLSNFGEILANKIQTSFKPKFTPGEDAYDKFTDYIDDYIYSEANIELFEAQKSVIQAVKNNLDENDATFLIAEMGSGKTTMGAAIPYVHNANRTKGYNVVVTCPSHLTPVWKREVEERIPNARAYVIEDYKELISLESKLRDKNKTENSYLILSKERAKMGYDKRPAAIWSRSKDTFVCPECGQTLYTEEYRGSGRHKRKIRVPFNELSMAKQLASNVKCMNSINKWDNKTKTFKEISCDASLWGPLNRDDNNHKWFKLGSEGWIYESHIPEVTERLMGQETLTKKEAGLFSKLMEQYELIQEGEAPYCSYKGSKKYPIAKYIRENMKNVFDYCIIDECHEMKGLTEQGQAAADLMSSSKKSILLTGTLLNGYADGLYYLLWRAVPRLMRKEGFKFSDEAEFARIYGVFSREMRYQMQIGRRARRIGGVKEKRLPGVSPLVFTRFLLDNAVFLSLSDMSTGLPGYEEIPVPVSMSYELLENYRSFENAFGDYARAPRGSKKAMGPFLQALSAYPDCPHMVSPIVSNDTGEILFNPPVMQKENRDKEEALLELVKERIANGEKVMLFYTWVNKTDVGSNLIKLLKDNGINVCEMKSSITASEREAWVNKKIAEGMQVMICNPKLVETGLTLLDFTSIIFYQMGHNLFTMRQASRRSWRLSQTKDVKVYFMYYQSSIQEQILSLMATKLQAAMALEGKFSEEGLRAMSNNEDILTQIANNVVEGIKDTINQDIFKAAAFIKSDNIENREHLYDSSLFKFKLNNKGHKTIFTNEIETPKRKTIKVNDNLLNNPIALFC